MKQKQTVIKTVLQCPPQVKTETVQPIIKIVPIPEDTKTVDALNIIAACLVCLTVIQLCKLVFAKPAITFKG